MNRFVSTLIAFCTLAIAGSAAHAALFVHVTGGQAAPGGTVTVGVFVTNDTTDPDVSSSLVNSFNAAIFVDPAAAATGGGFGIATRTDTGSGYAAPQFLAAGDFFDGGDYQSSAMGGTLADGQSRQAFSFLADSNAGESIAAANGEGLFQTTFSVPSDALPGTVYTIRVDDQASSFATPGDDSSLVQFTPGTATITVVALPEPAALSTLGSLVCVFLCRRSKR